MATVRKPHWRVIVIDKPDEPYPIRILRTTLLSNSFGDLGRGETHAAHG
jgi:hypothetical protein